MYVVTGATGNTGNIVARTLLAAGQKVRALGRSADRLAPLVSAGAEPFVCDVTDAEALTRAFSGARAIYAMIPPSLTSQDYRADQDRITAAIARAVEQAGVKHAVSLSSVGADKPQGTGPIAGLHNLEQALNRIPELNVLHLRAGYFMENTLAQIGTIHSFGMAAGPLNPDLMIPMIAARDIGSAAAQELLELNFSQQHERELLGERDINMTEATTIIGQAIGKPDLKYSQVPNEIVRAALIQVGMSANMADLILEMASAMNSDHVKPLEKRSAANTTPTSFESFVQDEFVSRFRGRTTSA